MRKLTEHVERIDTDMASPAQQGFAIGAGVSPALYLGVKECGHEAVADHVGPSCHSNVLLWHMKGPLHRDTLPGLPTVTLHALK